MAEFLQSYGLWIFVGLFLLLMIFGRRRGMGCGMGGCQHGHEDNGEPEADINKSSDSHRSAGCH